MATYFIFENFKYIFLLIGGYIHI